MMKKFAFAGVGLLMLVSPVIASADTLTDLQAQLAALMTELRSLQAQLLSQQDSGQSPRACTMEAKVCPDGTSVGRTGPNCEFAACPTNAGGGSDSSSGHDVSRWCGVFTRTLVRGMRGDDVRQLQSLLVDQGLLSEENVSGYFGPMTEAAVNQFQDANDLIAGSVGGGSFGPMSRDWLAKRCTPRSTVFSASLTSGSAPLTVTFSTMVNTGFTPDTYRIDYGDGASEAPAGCIAPTDACTTPGTNVHTYSSNGTYTATLTRISQNTCTPTSGTVCAAWVSSSQVIGSVVITVGDGAKKVVFSASPSSGPAPLNVTFTEAGLAAGTYDVNFGDLSSGQLTVPNIQCIRAPCDPGAQSISHTYTAPGEYDVVLSPYYSCLHNPVMQCMIAVVPLARVHVSVTGGNVGDPSISVKVSPATVAQKQQLAIVWQAQNAPKDSAVVLSLQSLGGNVGDGRIAGQQPTSGTYMWTVPESNCKPDGTCMMMADNPMVWATNPGQYKVIAQLYTPAAANLGGGLMPPSANLKYLASDDSDVFTITGTKSSGNMVATPTSGSAPLAVTFSGDTGTGCNGGNFTLNFGDGQSQRIAIPADSCNGTYKTTHTYTSVGTYVAKLSDDFTACIAMVGADCSRASVTIVVGGGTSGGGVSINGLDAPSSLNVGQTGTWTVRATASTGSQLHYSVLWGDEGMRAPNVSLMSANMSTVQTSGTFTHAYQTSGTYTPTFTVSTDDGGYAKTSSSLTVGSLICPAVALSANCTYGYHPVYAYDSNGCKMRVVNCEPDPMPSGRGGMCPTSNDATYSEGTTLDGQLISGSPYTYSAIWPRYTCTKGVWVCTQFCPEGVPGAILNVTPQPVVAPTTVQQSDSNSNVANALTALQDALKAIIAKYGR